MRPLSGERKALAAAVLAFYGFFFLLVALAPPGPGWGACFGALAAVYGLGFVAVVAGYFWGRWFTMGLGLSGSISAAISLWQAGVHPVFVFYGATHLIIFAMMWGKGMAAGFDGRKEWRKRFHLDDTSTDKLGKAVVRAGVSLPYILMYALAPKDGAGGMILTLAGATLAVLGVHALIKLRSWGVLALAGSAATLAASLAWSPGFQSLGNGWAVNLDFVGMTAVVLLALAVAPFAGPVLRYLRTPIEH